MLVLTPEEIKAVLEILKKVSFTIDTPKEKVDALQSAYQKLLASLTP
jgi:hypothetical protein